MKPVPDHVAVLVPSVVKAAAYLRKFDFKIAEEDVFEETREIYVEHGKGNSLLLMQPNGPGTYQRALEKRGPGLHHLAINVEDLEKYVSSLAGSGWLLHPSSLQMARKARTAYLARPGFPGLIEVQQSDRLDDRPLFVSQVEISLEPKLHGLVKAIGLDNVIKPAAKERFTIGGRPIEIRDLL